MARDGSVVYRFRKPQRFGKQAVVMDPLTFLSRLAALIPPQRFHMLSYYGVLAPAASRRDEIVRALPRMRGRAPLGSADEEEPSSCHAENTRAMASSSDAVKQSERRRPERLTWAELVRRVWLTDVLRRPCGGRRRVLSMVFNPHSIERILRHLGLPHVAPPRAPPRPMPAMLPFSA